ncbi:retrovirus-related pol polyprotein from transposon TNT 1-94 [Tanacetum coccineum]
MLIFSRAPLFLWAEAIATACYTQNRSIIHRQFNKTPYELINGIKPDISFLYVFGALCYLKNDHEDIGKLGTKDDIGFFIAMAFEQSSLRPGLQSMNYGQISSRLDLTYAPTTITTLQPTEGELDLLFEAMYDDYIGGKPSAALRTIPAAHAPQFFNLQRHLQTTADIAPTPTKFTSPQATSIQAPQKIDETRKPNTWSKPQPASIADNVSNAMFDDNTFINPFATPSTSAADSSSSQYVDPSNMHTFYQPYSH